MPKRTGRPWQRVKARVIKRDHGICHLCGQPGADSADHLTPVALGGALYDMTNLAAVHHNVQPRCNRVRGTGSIQQARTRLHSAPTDHDGGWTW